MRAGSISVRRTWAIVGLAALLQACAPGEHVIGRAVNYNLALEEAENRALLLNIVRASKRRPLYYTAFDALRGDLTSTASLEATAEFGFDADGLADRGLVLGPTLELSDNPSFDLVALDKKEFANGILSPIDMLVLQLLHQQENDIGDTLYRFVDAIQLDIHPRGGSGQPLETIIIPNDPLQERDPESSVFFSCYVSLFESAGLRLVRADDSVDTTLRLAPGNVGNVAQIADALEKGIELEQEGERTVKVLQSVEDAAFDIPYPREDDRSVEPVRDGPSRYIGVRIGDDPRAATGQAAKLRADRARTAAQARRTAPVTPGVRLAGDAATGVLEFYYIRETDAGPQILRRRLSLPAICPGLSPDAVATRDGFLGRLMAKDRDVEVTFIIRSTEGAIRYLGRALAAQMLGKPVPAKVASMLKVEVTAPDTRVSGSCGERHRYLTQITYDDEQYRVCSDSGSARTLALLQRLITLHKEAEEAPVTRAVKLVGGGRLRETR